MVVFKKIRSRSTLVRRTVNMLITNVSEPVTTMAVLFCKNFLKIQFLMKKIVFRNLAGAFLQLLQPAEILPGSLHVQGYPHFPANYMKGD